MASFKKQLGLYVIPNYYLTEINLDTSLDARHVVSLLTSFFPDISVTYTDKCCLLNNVRNSQHQKVKVTWLYQI